MSDWNLYEKPGTSRARLSETDLEREELKRKSLLLIEETKRSFSELTNTLFKEQTRLLELEEKRKRLRHQMLELKADIDKEKEACRLELQDLPVKPDAAGSGKTYDDDELEKKVKLLTVGTELVAANKERQHDMDDKSRRSSLENQKDLMYRLEGLLRQNSKTSLNEQFDSPAKYSYN